MRKTPQIILFLSMIIIALSACKKNSDPTPGSMRLLNAEINMDRYIKVWTDSRSIRNRNPYSFSTLRKAKELLLKSADAEVRAIVNKPLSAANVQYYYKIPLNTEANRTALQGWLNADTNRAVFDFPLDSISMYPEDFEGKLETIYQQQYAYTNTFATDPLPSSINATIIDTLYVPDSRSSSDEYFIDVMAHILTSNISPQYMRLFDEADTSIVNNIIKVNQLTLLSGSLNLLDVDAPDGIGLVLQGSIDDIVGSIKEWVKHPPRPADKGSIAFQETQNNNFEGINNIRIKIVNFTFLTHTAHMYNTDQNGNFNIGWLPPGTGTMVFEFANNKVKVIDADFRSTGADIWTVLNLPYAARDVRFYWYTQPGNMEGIRYAHGTKSALWGMIMNGIQEANKYTVQENLRSNANHNPFLTIYGMYSRARPRMGSGSAPMFAHTGANSAQLNYLYGLFGFVGSAPHGLSNMPDLLICQSEDNPYESNDLRQTIYHEYGHSLHYFKAGDLFWSDNILKTIGQRNAPDMEDYGAAINTIPGDFFALTEGWADYVGNSFGAKKYPATSIFWETSRDQGGFDIYSANANYLTHLKKI